MNTRKVVPGLAERLQTARSAAGLSQVAAGERAGVHPVSVAKFETEKTVPTLDVLYRLAAAYGVSVCDLLPAAGDSPDAGRARAEPDPALSPESAAGGKKATGKPIKGRKPPAGG